MTNFEKNNKEEILIDEDVEEEFLETEIPSAQISRLTDIHTPDSHIPESHTKFNKKTMRHMDSHDFKKINKISIVDNSGDNHHYHHHHHHHHHHMGGSGSGGGGNDQIINNIDNVIVGDDDGGGGDDDDDGGDGDNEKNISDVLQNEESSQVLIEAVTSNGNQQEEQQEDQTKIRQNKRNSGKTRKRGVLSNQETAVPARLTIRDYIRENNKSNSSNKRTNGDDVGGGDGDDDHDGFYDDDNMGVDGGLRVKKKRRRNETKSIEDLLDMYSEEQNNSDSKSHLTLSPLSSPSNEIRHGTKTSPSNSSSMNNNNDNPFDMFSKKNDMNEDQDFDEIDEENDVNESYSEKISDAGGPQVQIINGEIVFTGSSNSIQQEIDYDAEGYEHVVETYGTKYINQNTYSRHNRGDKWTKEETEEFYNALRQFGSNFSLICRLFPKRTRRQVKNKYKREEKQNRKKVEHALRNPLPIDIEKFNTCSAEKDRLQGVDKNKEAEEERRREEEAEMAREQNEELERFEQLLKQSEQVDSGDKKKEISAAFALSTEGGDEDEWETVLDRAENEVDTTDAEEILPNATLLEIQNENTAHTEEEIIGLVEHDHF